MGLIDRALGLFGRGRERAYRERWHQASDLLDKGEMAEARALYERLVVEATELYGADAEQTLLTRYALASTYRYDAPERACQLLEQVVQDGERLFGPVDDGRLAPCLRLAAMYGQAGDHAKCHELSKTILADCDRLLGPEHFATAEARDLLRRSTGDLARANLAAFLDIPWDSFAEEPAPEDWKERLLAGASTIEAARSYRARMLWDSKPSSGASDERHHWVYDFEFVRPDRFHLERDTGPDFDEWIVLGDEHYSGPLLWLNRDDEMKAGHDRENRLLLADGYLDLLRGTAPIAVNVRRGGQAAYLVAEYPTVAQAWSDIFQGALAPREARTSLWIDLAQGLLHMAEGTFVLPANPEGGAVSSSFKHGFASYGEDIAIEAPEPLLEFDGDG